MLKNIKLKSKMIYAFSLIIILMFIAVGFSLFGLNKNNHQISNMKDMTVEASLATDVETELLNSVLVFKEFFKSGDTALIDVFETHKSTMQSKIEELENMNHDTNHHESIAKLQSQMTDYSDGFSTFQSLDAERLAYYTNLSADGGHIVNSLNTLLETSIVEGNINIQLTLSEATNHLLEARLHGMKFFTFHDQGEYDNYYDNYQLFKGSVKSLDALKGNQNYQYEYQILAETAITYEVGMKELNQLIVLIDNQVKLMDSIDNQISATVDEITTSIHHEEIELEKAVKLQSQILIIVALIMAVTSIVFTFIISSWLLKIVIIPIESLRKTFDNISEGDVDLEFRLNDNSNDEIGLMSKSFNRFMVNLKELMDTINDQNWIKTAQNDLNKVIREPESIEGLSDNILRYISEYINAEVGLLYINDDEELKLTGTYAVSSQDDIKPTMQFGEGIIGQCALEKKVKRLKTSSHYLNIESGLGKEVATSIVMIPCIYEDDVKAIIELGSIHKFNENELDLLKTLADAIAISIHSTLVQLKLKELLEKTLHQSEELQMQQEELRQSNEELEEQTRALKESEQRLQAQQEELRVSNEELEQRAKQLEFQKKALDETNKEIMIKQQEIIEKADALELANTYKSEFLANMSHELRTPLNSILVLSQLLSERNSLLPLNDKEKEFAETIHSSGTDLLVLINDVLDLSKVEAGHLEIIHEPFELEKLLVENNRMFKPMTDSKSIVFKTSLEAGLPKTINSDFMRIQQIIKNLISNSIKFTENGDVTLAIRRPTDFEADTIGCDKNKHIAFIVSDTGIGIPKDKQQLIFEAFRQSDGTTSRKYGGTGLGLTISRELSNMLEGRILVESTIGQGSKFVFIVPTNNSEETNFIEKEIVTTMEPTEPILLTENIKPKQDNLLLIIEDDLNFANILKNLSEEKGFDCIVAHNGLDGYHLALEERPSAIVLDLGLPDMDGMELVEKLSKIELTKSIPIHIISGMDSKPDDLLPSSVIGFLKKPVDIKSIYKTLAKIESLSASDQRRLLIVGECNGENFEQFSSLGQMNLEKTSDISHAISLLEAHKYNCMVVDFELDTMTGDQFIHDYVDLIKDTPIIIYSENELTNEKLNDINRYTDSIILKSPKSEERMVDEVSLFLHGMRSVMTESTQGNTHYKSVIMDELSDKIKAEDQFEGKKILVVDDDERNVYALTNVLYKHGFKVAVSNDGLDSIEKVKSSEKYDLILMDIMMPKMDGYEAIKNIRTLPKGKDIPIIALTAKAMQEDRMKCINAGANDYMTKPIDIEKLLSIMKVWLS
ncbi:MAG: response regulator [Clostridiales bacterium]|nr:response regulator [Clostridiales bacterium]